MPTAGGDSWPSLASAARWSGPVNQPEVVEAAVRTLCPFVPALERQELGCRRLTQRRTVRPGCWFSTAERATGTACGSYPRAKQRERASGEGNSAPALAKERGGSPKPEALSRQKEKTKREREREWSWVLAKKQGVVIVIGLRMDRGLQADLQEELVLEKYRRKTGIICMRDSWVLENMDRHAESITCYVRLYHQSPQAADCVASPDSPECP